MLKADVLKLINNRQQELHTEYKLTISNDNKSNTVKRCNIKRDIRILSLIEELVSSQHKGELLLSEQAYEAIEQLCEPRRLK